MKSQPKEQLSKGMEQLYLPSQTIGTTHITLNGDRQVLICGQKGIRSYESGEIIVELEHCGLSVRGDKLGIVTMNAQELLLRGQICVVEFLK